MVPGLYVLSWYIPTMVPRAACTTLGIPHLERNLCADTFFLPVLSGNLCAEASPFSLIVWENGHNEARLVSHHP